MSNTELNFCIRHTLDREMSPAYSRVIMSLAKLYDTDRDAYNKAVMELSGGRAVVTMQLHKRYKGVTGTLIFFFNRLLSKCLFLYKKVIQTIGMIPIVYMFVCISYKYYG